MKKILIKTHFITVEDNLKNIILKYVIPVAKNGDIIVLCEKIVSITQNRVVYKKDIKLSWWAKNLSKFAMKTPTGFSVGNPYKMQVAIDSAGLLRILLASFLSGLCKIFGIRGIFYIVAGHGISRIDGFYGETFEQYANIGILGCKNGNEVCEDLKKEFGFSFAIADVNDIGLNIIGKTSDLDENFLKQNLKDNPATQSAQQTPIVILREK